MASPPFTIQTTLPSSTDLASQFPSVEQTFRDVVNSWLSLLSDPTTGKLLASAFPDDFALPANSSTTGSFSINDVSSTADLIWRVSSVVRAVARYNTSSGWTVAVRNSSGTIVGSTIALDPTGVSFTFGGEAVLTTGSTIPLGNTSGTLALNRGGTGATTAAGARTNFGLGSVATLNSISLSANVTGTLGIANGGTGSTSAAGARSNLGLGTLATKNDASLSADVTGTLAIGNGGTSATSAASARANLGVGALGTYSSITAAGGVATTSSGVYPVGVIAQLQLQTGVGNIGSGNTVDGPHLQLRDPSTPAAAGIAQIGIWKNLSSSTATSGNIYNWVRLS